MLKFVVGILNFQPHNRTLKNIFFYVLNINFSYTQLSFVFLFALRKILISITMMLTLFFLFFFRNIFISLSSLFLPFLFFFFRKILTSFACFFAKLFFVFFGNIYLPFLYMYTKKYKKFCIYTQKKKL